MEIEVEEIENKGVITPYDFTEEEFWEEIRKGEEGPFMSMEELKRSMNKWMTNSTSKK
jgi:hypothetical protein